MTRKRFLQLGAAVPASARLSAGQARPAGGRPRNVLFLMADQHCKSVMGVAGDQRARTPNLDALARSGVRFSNAYCTNPLCTPSRASILTGLYTHHHRTWSNTTPWPFEFKTMAHAFRRAGYCSGSIGKMHFVDAQTHGFDYRLDFNDWYQSLGPAASLFADELGVPNSGSGLPQIDDLWKDHGDPWASVRNKDARQGPVQVGRASLIPESDHFESFVARESNRFLRRFGGKEPFFLISSFLKPHDPFMPPARFAEMYAAAETPMPRTWNRVNRAAVPAEIRRRMERDAPTPELADPKNAKQRIAMYYANVAFMDQCLGSVLDTLRAMNLERDTIVLYASDHGEMLGEHNLWNKFVLYDPSVGVPLIIRAPGVTGAGGEAHSVASLVDLFPTLLDLCGLDGPRILDGESLAPVLRQPGLSPNRAVFAQTGTQSPRPSGMLREGIWKYIDHPDDVCELYDLRQDPDELDNVAIAQATRAAEMKAKLREWCPIPVAVA